MKTKYQLKPIDTIMAATICASLMAEISFIFGFFRPQYTMWAGFVIGILCMCLVEYRTIRVHLIPFLLAVGILVVALIFRLMPFNYVMGGQDQGVYVNMSAHYQKQGAPFFIDNVRESIESEELKKIYDANHLGPLPADNRFDGRHEGAFAPGVYVKNWDKGQYVFQFYHLHPLWMAMFAQTFGNEARVFSLTFFSLLSIIGFYFLSYELSKNRVVSFLAAFFIAINPLHAFFSKFPVSEIPALSFSSFGFYYMARMWKNIEQREADNARFWLPCLLSLGCFSCFFLTRISGFLYMPLFFVLCLTSIVCLSKNTERRIISSFFIILMLLYLVSVCYGLYTSFPYSKDIYLKLIEKINHKFGKEILFGLVIMMTGALYLAIRLRCNTNFATRIKKVISFSVDKLPMALFFIIGIGLIKIFLLGYTDHYISDRWINNRWGIANKDFGSIFHGSILVSIKYISPFLFSIFLFYIKELKKNLHGRIILMFLTGFWFYIAFLLWIVPYEFYYARYLLTEIVPYTILAALLCIGTAYKHSNKNGLIVMLLLASGYFLYATSLQVGYNISKNPRKAINQLTDQIDPNALILIKDNFSIVKQVETPLRFYYGKNTFKFNNWYDFAIIVNSNDVKKYSSLYLLSGKECNDEYFMPEKSVDFEYVDYGNKKIGWNPFRRPIQSIALYLYRIDLNKAYETNGVDLIKGFETNVYAKIYPRIEQGLSLSGFYSDNIWTNGDAIIKGLSIDMRDSKDPILSIKRIGWHPHGAILKSDMVRIYVNQKKIELKENGKKYMAFSIPADIKFINEIRISSSTFVPAELGINSDKRILGVDIDEIIIWKKTI